MRFDLLGDGFCGVWVHGRAVDEDFAREVFCVVGLLEERFEGGVVVNLVVVSSASPVLVGSRKNGIPL